MGLTSLPEVGRSATFERSWTSDHALLYGLAVGAGVDPLEELAYTTENSTGIRQRVLPSFGALINQAQLPGRLGFGDLPKGSMVYAEQTVELLNPLPPEGKAEVTAQVTGLLDKGSGALLRVSTGSVEHETGLPLVRTECSYFIRGAGGFGGERGESASDGLPARPADRTIRVTTRPDQALLYRLTGDRNPLHSDPRIAAKAGFDRPILHGLCTFGIVGLELVRAFCAGDETRFGRCFARFRRPVLPGDDLALETWQTDEGLRFQLVHDRGAVLQGGTFTYRDADPSVPSTLGEN
ncbi:MaoC family dehydratase [Amycolatopsis acidicola]|nr:MaoC family dehydratase [Amycolatopsis acidicola]